MGESNDPGGASCTKDGNGEIAVGRDDFGKRRIQAGFSCLPGNDSHTDRARRLARPSQRGKL